MPGFCSSASIACKFEQKTAVVPLELKREQPNWNLLQISAARGTAGTAGTAAIPWDLLPAQPIGIPCWLAPTGSSCTYNSGQATYGKVFREVFRADTLKALCCDSNWEQENPGGAGGALPGAPRALPSDGLAPSSSVQVWGCCRLQRCQLSVWQGRELRAPRCSHLDLF